MDMGYNWLDNKIKIEDYLKNEILKEVEKEDEDENEINHCLMSNFALQILLEKENEIKKIFSNMKKIETQKLYKLDSENKSFLNANRSFNNKNNISTYNNNHSNYFRNNNLNFRNSNVNSSFSIIDESRFGTERTIDPMNLIIRKSIKKIKKESLSKSLINSVLNITNNYELEELELQTGNTETGRLKLYYEYGGAYMNNIFQFFKKINLMLTINKRKFLKNLTKKEIEVLTYTACKRADFIIAFIKDIKMRCKI